MYPLDRRLCGGGCESGLVEVGVVGVVVVVGEVIDVVSGVVVRMMVGWWYNNKDNIYIQC